MMKITKKIPRLRQMESPLYRMRLIIPVDIYDAISKLRSEKYFTVS